MPIQNEIISPIGGPVGSAEGVHVEGEKLGAALSDLGGAVGQWRAEKVVDEFKTVTDDEEAAFMEEQYQLIKERDKEAELTSGQDAIEAATSDPRARKMLYDMVAQDSAAEQGIIDNNRLGVRKEKIFREYAAKYPRLIPEFLKVASSSGLGGTSSLTTQEMTDYLNDGARQRQAELKATQSAQADYRKQVEKNALKMGLEPLPPSASVPELAAWTEKYIARANLHEAYRIDTEAFSLEQNNIKRDEHTVNLRLNELFANSGQAQFDEVVGIVNEVAGSLFGVSDYTKIGEAIQAGDIDRLNTTLRERIAKWKQDTMNRMGANTPGGRYITPQQWQQQFAAVDSFMEHVYSLTGTKQAADKMETLRKAHVQITEQQFSAVNQGLLNTLSGIKDATLRSGNAFRAVSQAVTTEALDKFNAQALTSIAAGNDDKPALVNEQGAATPFGGNNALKVAEATKGIKDQPTRERMAATHLELVDGAIRASGTREDADPTITSSVNNGLMSQVLSTMDYVGQKARESERRGKVYLPEDTLMASGVSAMASPEFGELFNTLDQRTRALAQDSMNYVLQYEVAYLAQLVNDKFQGYSKGARAGAANFDAASRGILSGFSGAMAPAPGDETLSTSSYDGEIFQINVNQETGDVAFVVSKPALKGLPPAQKIEAERYARNLTLEKGHRISNAIKAQVNLGLHADPAEALWAVADLEGWPAQLPIGVIGATKGASGKGDVGAPKTKAEQDAALERVQKEARGEGTE